MQEHVFVGRRRTPLELAAFQLVTLGVYGRVWLYKVLREIDGHGALFLDRRFYLPLLILPFIGPFFVKRRLAILLDDLLHHDVTSERYSLQGQIGLGLIPLVPVYHILFQRHLNHHWKMHAKHEELEIKQEQIAVLKRRSRSPALQAQARALEAEVAQRRKELDDLLQAAVALRAAEEIRRKAEAEIRTRAPRLSPAASLRKLLAFNPLRRRRRPAEQPEPEAAAEPEPVLPARKVREKPVGARVEEAEPLEAQPEPKRSLFRFLGRKGPREAPVPSAPAPSARPPLKSAKLKPSEAEPPKESRAQHARRWLEFLRRRPEKPGKADRSRADRKRRKQARRARLKAERQAAREARKKSKAEAKAAKREAKEHRKQEKLAAKVARREEKERRKQEKRAAKAAKRREKERRKQERAAAKARAEANRKRSEERAATRKKAAAKKKR